MDPSQTELAPNAPQAASPATLTGATLAKQTIPGLSLRSPAQISVTALTPTISNRSAICFALMALSWTLPILSLA